MASSNNFSRFYTSGVPNYEMVRIKAFTITWYPSLVTPVSGTFEPAAFDLRYIHNYASDSVLGSGYSGNYNEAHYNVLLSQTARPRPMTFDLTEIPFMLNDNNYPCLGSYVNAYAFNSNPQLYGGVLAIIQSTPGVNSVSSYNPKLGFVEIKFRVELINQIVG